MGETKEVKGLSANLKKAVRWISETVQEHPERSRERIITDAELRFDLAPRECEFLNSKFLELTTGKQPSQD